ncbi:MAG: phosphoglycerol geranylgeranyltransferase [Candidatus Hodarchaeales archaeon]
MKHSVYDFIVRKLQDHALLAVLLDPEFGLPEDLANFALQSMKKGADLIFIGGSSHVDTQKFFSCIKAVKKVIGNIPLILYTEDFNMVTKHADAILYGSVFNSLDLRYIIKMPVFSAPLIWKTLEALPTGFMVYEPGGTVGHVLSCNLLPRNNPKIGLAYAMSAELLGNKFVYLEAGSRAADPLTPEIVQLHRQTLSIPIIVGGGITTPKQASELVKAGASIIVVGTAFEQENEVGSFAEAIHETNHIVPRTLK